MAMAALDGDVRKSLLDRTDLVWDPGAHHSKANFASSTSPSPACCCCQTKQKIEKKHAKKLVSQSGEELRALCYYFEGLECRHHEQEQGSGARRPRRTGETCHQQFTWWYHCMSL